MFDVECLVLFVRLVCDTSALRFAFDKEIKKARSSRAFFEVFCDVAYATAVNCTGFFSATDSAFTCSITRPTVNPCFSRR
jgi:hypothetical protein